MAALTLVMGPSAWSAAPEIPGVLAMEIGVQSSQHSKIDSRLAFAEMAVSLQLSAKVPAKSCRKTKKENRDMAVELEFGTSSGLGSGSKTDAREAGQRWRTDSKKKSGHLGFVLYSFFRAVRAFRVVLAFFGYFY